jgi:cytochrome c peroxidase
MPRGRFLLNKGRPDMNADIVPGKTLAGRAGGASKGRRPVYWGAALTLFRFLQCTAVAADTVPVGQQIIENNALFPNPSGFAATFSAKGRIDTANEFFQPLGTNGRTCETCHRPAEGWSVTPREIRKRFDDSRGTDPIFRPNDGSNSPQAKVATVQERRKAYSMLLDKGVIRIGLKIPEDAEFELADAKDPYGFVTVDGAAELSLFRRPLPATNLKFLSAVMWDGRETVPEQTLHFDLRNQANTATTGHAQGKALTARQRQKIVEFETALFTAQVYDKEARELTAGTKGGPVNLSKQRFYEGINDLLDDSRTGLPFDPKAFDLYGAWDRLPESAPTDIRAAIARGQRLFNTRPLVIRDVAGLNDEAEFGSPAAIEGTCTTCHNAPNAGSRSVGAFLDIGTADESRRTPDMPLYTLRNKTTGALVKTTDPGRALVSGKWRDIGRFKVPTLRGLAARAPYFHNGMAAELGDVVDFYDSRFSMGLNNRERLDLIIFLRTL